MLVDAPTEGAWIGRKGGDLLKVCTEDNKTHSGQRVEEMHDFFKRSCIECEFHVLTNLFVQIRNLMNNFYYYYTTVFDKIKR